MRVYQLTLYDQDCGALLSWHPSMDAAKAALRVGISERGEKKTVLDTIEPHDIPTDKAGLLRWLNQHFKTNNG
jgi:hypothetical protein